MKVVKLGYVSRVMSAFAQQSCMLQAIASESLFLFPWLDCFRYISLFRHIKIIVKSSNERAIVVVVRIILKALRVEQLGNFGS